MKKNLGWKVILIIVTLLVFVWGFVLGTDPQRSLQAIKQQGLVAMVHGPDNKGYLIRIGDKVLDGEVVRITP